MATPAGGNTDSNDPDNLHPKGMGDLSWADAARGQSLNRIRQWALDEAEAAHEWYIKNKKPKQFFARWSRSIAIVLGALVGVWPVFGQIFGTAAHPWLLHPMWSTVLAAVVAILIALDRFMGWSTSWTRFIVAATDIRQSMMEFNFAWQQERLKWTTDPPNPEQTQQAIETVKRFALKVVQIVHDETAAWVAEFQSVLRQLDESAKVKADTSASPAINLSVTNGDQCDPPGWTLAIDTGYSAVHTGKTAALTGLPTGNRVLTVIAKIQGKQVQAQRAVPLVPGGPVAVELTLG